MKRFLLSSFLALVSYCMYAIDPNGARVDFGASQGDSGSLVFILNSATLYLTLFISA